MRLSPTLDKQLLDVIQWSEPEAGALAYRYPMLDTEIQTGAWLAVRESEMALFVDQERGADIFGPGLYAVNTENLPVLAGVKNWGKGFASPFRSDIYFFSMLDEFGQTWGTPAPVTLDDAESGANRVRGYGSYAYRIADVRRFFALVSGTRESYFVYDLDDRLRNTIVACMADVLGEAGLPGADMAANASALGEKMIERVKPVFAGMGLELTQFSVEAISLQSAVQDATTCDCCGASMRADHGVLKCDYCHAVLTADAGGDGVGVSTEFACPACEIPLMQARVGGASLLYCTRCDGMLVAMEEFEALVAAARALPGEAPVAAAEMHAAVACPDCGRAMGKSFYGGDVGIDSCEDCGLNWLDHGELARIAHAPVVEASGAYFSQPQVGNSTGLNV